VNEMPSLRQTIVREAAQRLADKGYELETDADGNQFLTIRTQSEIIKTIKGFVQLLGGVAVADRVLRILRDTNQIYDGIWLFGQSNLSPSDQKLTMPPFGWLFSIALSKLKFRKPARKPEIAWKTLVNLSTDFAAVHDCQRYDQFDEVFINENNLVKIFQNSILWREFFTLPQIPRSSFFRIVDALNSSISVEQQQTSGFAMSNIKKEIKQLVINSNPDRFTIAPREQMISAFPLLMAHSGGPKQNLNSEYGDPRAPEKRDHDQTVFIAANDGNFVILPTTLLCASVCQWLFVTVWKKFGNEAETIVKATMELAIADGCRAKSQHLIPNYKYKFDGDEFEMDVVAAENSHILLIETKAKSLTSAARSGDFYSFADDLAKSFLPILKQLARNESHLRAKVTGLESIESLSESAKVMKLAVSPLSYGPIADKLLVTQWMSALVNKKISSQIANNNQQKKLQHFNTSTIDALKHVVQLLPKENGKPVELTAYMIHLFWLDLGQLLYLVDRSTSIGNALEPLTYVTFGSRDMWSEIANVDRSGLSAGKWQPIK
jgi:hypothetical protein